MISVIDEFYIFAIFYGVTMCVAGMHLFELSEKDVDCRYTNPKEWNVVYILSLGLFLMHVLNLWPHHPDWIIASLIWILITYLVAKIPQIKIMGGNDARVMICAGLMFPHWLTIPVVFCTAIIAAHIKKKKGTDEMRDDWKRRGVPMVPFLTMGWLFSAFVFQMMFIIF